MSDAIFLPRQRYAIKMLDKLASMENPAFLIVASGYVDGTPIELREEVLCSDPRIVARLLSKAYDKYAHFIELDEQPTEEEGPAEEDEDP